MKRVNFFSYALAFMVLFSSCSDSEINELQEEQTLHNFPPRPEIGPGESSVKTTVGENSTQKMVIAATNIITTDLSSKTAEDIVATMIGAGVDAPSISNVSFTGASRAAGTFVGGTGIIGFESGIILSSGDIALVAGPNQYDGITANNDLPGDSDLDGLIPGYTTEDATVLEFDFECSTTQFISFEYVFTSEEYNEYVNSQYNDVFAFYLNGENIALIPETDIPVAINNVNCGNPYNTSAGTNCDLYINNDITDGGGAINTEMDGLTVVFTATGALQPGVNHIKLAIADAGDKILDSNVFIKAESFLCTQPEADLAIDIHPGSCPNPLSLRAKGVLPVSINGSETFDVNEIEISTVTLEGVSPIIHSIADVSTRFDVNLEEPLDPYSCNTLEEDGFKDMILQFDYEELRSVLGELERGEVFTLEIKGELKNGTAFSGKDIVVVK